jgi:hypothetical protein
MIIVPPHDAKRSARFAAPPWNEDAEPWLELDAQLPSDHLAREIRGVITYLDLTSLYLTYGGRGKTTHPPDLMLAIVLFERRRGQRKPGQCYRDTQENVALWWLGFGIRPSRSCWYEFRVAPGPVSTLSMQRCYIGP